MAVADKKHRFKQPDSTVTKYFLNRKIIKSNFIITFFHLQNRLSFMLELFCGQTNFLKFLTAYPNAANRL